jgi:hypothetical protein
MLGDEVHHIATEQFERAAQNHGRRDAVHVVIPVDGDPLLAGHRTKDPIHGGLHAGQRHRIVELIE